MSTPLDHPECLLSLMIVLGADGSFHGPKSGDASLGPNVRFWRTAEDREWPIADLQSPCEFAS